MRLGGPCFGGSEDPHAWADWLKKAGYRATYFPLPADTEESVIKAYVDAARKTDIMIAEVGAWSNPISPDDVVRKAAFEHCCRQLDLADRVGAQCCVNIAGARGEQWDAPYADNLTAETFDMIVECVRAIIDAVKPTRTYYALETMPWVFPDSPASYADLIDAIDRPAFAVHLDPVNLVNSPARYFKNTDLILECFALLGPHIKSAHAKDITLAGKLTVHLDETRPGLGALDYGTFLSEIERLGRDIPVMLEHLSTEEEYRLAAEHLRKVASEIGARL